MAQYRDTRYYLHKQQWIEWSNMFGATWVSKNCVLIKPLPNPPEKLTP